MTTYDMTDFAAQVDGVLRPLGITRNMRAYHTLSEALRLICEQEDRLEAVQKEIYEPIADRHCCDWTAIQSMIAVPRRPHGPPTLRRCSIWLATR